MSKPPVPVCRHRRHRVPPPKHPQTPPSDQPPPPPPPTQEQQFMNSLNELEGLRNAIETFKRNFDELKSLLNYIENGVASLSSQLHQSVEEEERARKENSNKKFDLNRICIDMNGKGLRSYVQFNLRNPNNKLREKLPMALKLAPNPGKLVLESLGDLHVRQSVAFARNRHLALSRNAALMILELFLMMEVEGDAGGVGRQIGVQVKEEAAGVATAWRHKIDSEGGVKKATEIDARGLLLLIAGFGICTVFRSDFVWDLVVRCDLEQAAGAMKRSRNFVAWVSDYIERMTKSGMEIEAVDVARHFGIGYKFPPEKLLPLFLQKTEEALKKTREANSSLDLLKEANEKHLAAVKTVIQFIDERQLNPSKILPGWRDMMRKVEEDIGDLKKVKDDNPLKPDRKADTSISTNFESQDTKRPRQTAKSSLLISSPRIELQEQKVAVDMKGEGSCDASKRRNSVKDDSPVKPKRKADARISTNFEREDTKRPRPTGNSSPLISSPGIELQENKVAFDVKVESSYDASNRRNSVDRELSSDLSNSAKTTPPGTAASNLDNMPLHDNDSRCSYSSDSKLLDGVGNDSAPAPSMHVSAQASLPYEWYGFGEPATAYGSMRRRSIRQSVTGLCGPSPLLEGFIGLPDSPPGGVVNPADLYRFVDSVVEPEYMSSRISLRY